jgi:hypothetical protein
MRLPDDEINERLRRALTDKFSSTKEQPDPALAHIVLNSVQSRARSTMPYRLLLTAVLVLITTMRPERYAVLSRIKSRAVSAIRPTEVKKGIYSTDNKHIKNQFANPPLSIDKTNTATDKQQQQSEQKSIAVLPDESGRQSEILAADAISIGQNINAASPALLDNSGYIASNALQLPAIVAPKENDIAEKPRHNWHLVLEFTPMNTYQVVRIGKNQPVQYQNFAFPETFSNKKTAYQFQTGMERNGLQLHIGYVFSRQSFQYEIATDEFVLDKQNQVVRKGISEYVDNTLHFGNIGISKEVSFNHSKFNGYFIRAGADLSREFTTKQNVLWGTAAFGKVIPLGPGSALHVGPYIEYAFNKMRSKDAGFMLQPYQAGLSIQFKYKLKPNR